jgi:hypothetical protein
MRRTSLPIPIFRNEINAVGNFRGGVKVRRDFAVEGAEGVPQGDGCRGAFGSRRATTASGIATRPVVMSPQPAMVGHFPSCPSSSRKCAADMSFPREGQAQFHSYHLGAAICGVCSLIFAE